MLKHKLLRNYQTNIEAKLLDNEHIIVANNKLKGLLDGTRSTATINTYLYICLKVNKSEDISYLRNTRCKDISYDLGIPLSTIQEALTTLIKTNFIVRTFNEDRSSDYQVVGYKNILSKSYTKIPASLVLNDTFLQSSKDETSAMLSVYSSIYSHAVASMKRLQSISFLKDKQNFELVDQAETNRVFSKKNLLNKIKRINSKDLDRVLEKLQQLGLSVNNMFKEGISKSTNYLIGIDRDALGKLFRPFISQSHIKNNPLAFDTVDKLLCGSGLYKHIGKQYYDDLTQMYVQYGDLYFNAGILALQNVVYNNYSLTDESGSKIENICAYFRTSVESFIEKCKSKK